MVAIPDLDRALRRALGLAAAATELEVVVFPPGLSQRRLSNPPTVDEIDLAGRYVAAGQIRLVGVAGAEVEALGMGLWRIWRHDLAVDLFATLLPPAAALTALEDPAAGMPPFACRPDTQQGQMVGEVQVNPVPAFEVTVVELCWGPVASYTRALTWPLLETLWAATAAAELQACN